MVSKKADSKRSRAAKNGATKTLRLLKSLELPNSQKPDLLAGPRLLGRKNRLDLMFSSQTTEPIATGTDIESDTPEEIVVKSNFEEDDGFIYKRTDKKGNKSKISTPISKLSQALSELPPDDLDDSFDLMDFQPVAKKTAPKRRKVGAGARLSSPIQSKYDDDYVEQVSHHKITLRGEEPASKKDRGRRVSYNKRGKRILSIGNGFLGLPHDDVAAQGFYKLLDTSLPEPHRMRQLLVWCSSRKLAEEEKKRPSSEDQTAVNIAKVIKEEVLQDLRDSQISTSWYNKPEDESDDSLINKEIVLPNPLNDEALKNITIYTQELQRLVQEREQWQKAYEAAAKRLTQLQAVSSSRDISSSQFLKYLKQRPDTSAEFVDAAVHQTVGAELALTLDEVREQYVENIENAVDRLAQITHQMAQVHQTIDRFHTTELAPAIASVAQSYVQKGTIDRLRDSYDKVWPVANTAVSTETLLRGITRLDCQGQQRA